MEEDKELLGNDFLARLFMDNGKRGNIEYSKNSLFTEQVLARREDTKEQGNTR